MSHIRTVQSCIVCAHVYILHKNFEDSSVTQALVVVVRARDQAIEAANVDLRDLVTTLRQQIDLNKEMQNKMEAVIHQAVYRSVSWFSSDCWGFAGLTLSS